MNANSTDSSIDEGITLVVFCRRPRPGIGKSRIAAALGAGATAELAGHLLATALEDARAWPGPVIIAPADPRDGGWAAELLPGCADVIAQPAGNLGQRINAVDRAARARGHRRLVFIGSDAPALTPGFFARARAALGRTDVVLGPADDGGLTLLGAARPWPELVSLPWSSQRLGEEVHRACRERGLRVELLERSYDVDRAAQLERLERDLSRDPRPARRALLDWLRRRPQPSVSVVIPVLGDHAPLSGLLETIRRMASQPAEIIVTDAGDDPACEALCTAHHCTHVRTRPGRGHQLHAGATRASGDVIWFLHADASPPSDALDRIRAHMSAGAIGGYFRFRFAGPPGWHKRLLAALINLRCRFGVPYGDQGLFVSRTAYRKTQGFADAPLFEEVSLVRSLRAAGRFDSIGATLGVSPRRWERDGWLRRTLNNRVLALGYALGVPPEQLARRYHAARRTDVGRGSRGKGPARC